MYVTLIENKPKTYTRPTLIARNFTNIVVSELSEDESELIIEYKFDNNPNNSHSGYDLTPVGSIQYNTSPNSVELNGIDQYLSVNIDFEVKTLSFWFNLTDVNTDNYLLSFDNDFYINVDVDSLDFQNCNITQTFSADVWYNLALTSNNANYDIYLDDNKLPETIPYKDLSSSTLNIGKYTDDDADAEIDTENIESHDIRLGGKSRYTMVADSSNIYMFGGEDTSDYAPNILYKINTSYNFEEISLTGDENNKPSSRIGHSMVIIESNIYIFGGYIPPNTVYYSNLYKIDTTDNTSEKITLIGDDSNKPCGRINHSMVAYGSNIYIFGGTSNGGIFLDDLYKIDTTNNNSKKITLSGSGDNIPSARNHHTMVVIGDDMYIFGGNGEGVYNKDLYKIDITTNTSVKIDVTGDMQSIIKHSSMVAINNYMYIFGGIVTDQTILNDLYRIDTTGYSEKITLPEDQVSKRYYHTMVILNNSFFIYGGFYLGQRLDDLIKIPFTFNTHYLNGKIADLRLYNYLLTDISTIYDEFVDTIPSLPT